MFTEPKESFDELYDCFKSRKFADLRIRLLDMEPVDIADFMEERLDETDQLLFFRLLPKELASDVFVEIDSDTQEELIKKFTDKELKAVIDDMFLDDTVDIIDEMPANVVKRILKNSDPENRKQINELLEYPDDSAGSLMTTEYVSLSENMTVEQAFDKIRKTGLNKETVYTCYVTDGKKHLIGVITVKTLLLSDVKDVIADIMDTNVIAVETLEDKEQVAMKFSDYDFLALPVVDKEGCIVGIVTVDDAVDVLKEEATEDIQKMAAIVPNEKPYLKQSVWRIWSIRIPWLLVLMISATFTGIIINSYEGRLNLISPLLFACIPMLMDTGGNAGSQASVTVIRSLALDELQTKDVFKVLWKEIRVSVLLATTLAAVCFAKLLLLDNLVFGYDYKPMICLVVSLSLFATVVIAKLVGCFLPIVAKKIKLDPAVVASPFITTIVDALSLIVYCNVAIALLT
ncbi:MAG: magnesium transporter [Candidatus Borkfalkiaceae bacterium]|nr:magnesium transporter [Christensenellaceae bacterium]